MFVDKSSVPGPTLPEMAAAARALRETGAAKAGAAVNPKTVAFRGKRSLA
jgi:hypothetical protein